MENTTIQDLIGIEHSKLNFFQELQQTIVELKASHEKSEAQRREFAAIFDGITDLMMVLSEDMRIISVNHVFMEIFPEGDPRGKYCYELFTGNNVPCPKCPAFQSLRYDKVSKETAIFRIGNRNMHFEMVSSPLKSPHLKEHQVVIFKRNVTMEKEYQAKFYQAEKMATMGVLAAGVAHEINNPLTAVSGFAEGIRRRIPKLEGHMDEKLIDDFKEYTDTILKECQRCQAIVQTLLTFSRPTKAAFQPVDINSVVEDTVRILQHHFKKRPGLTVVLQLQRGLPHIIGDEAQLKQVALNLLTNAVDAIEDNGTVTVTTDHAPETQGVRLMVQDTGCGIPEDKLNKLFEPFFTTKPVGKGIGIGLATCYSIVQEHEGDISITSALGEGTCFTVTLPQTQVGVHA
ncbi:two-component system sensor histidine kinase NtrB [Desulfovibrio psychrotolerans]|uniref:histidine kinase n=1 Tax=Desulfovibrio psychrotolerans TaxID=415242 RepID=A0A7J0BXY8_9BACT|nr:ATP-binding protein [Desulfovibrio psychrotolerans]GFM38052.1 sensor histidine kinase [Desulfovibrio psychrotolerans]